jgi:uncharacterized glyoxalase superfamily protein PhnB
MPDTSSPASCPYLFCDDLERQIAFLERAFGLSAARVDRDPDGHVQHAQLVLGAAKVMLGGVGTYEGYRPRKSPEALGGLNAGVYLFVDDVDAHARHARAAGAKILMEPADMHWGDRLYCAEDPEGQFWMFATPKG